MCRHLTFSHVLHNGADLAHDGRVRNFNPEHITAFHDGVNYALNANNTLAAHRMVQAALAFHEYSVLTRLVVGFG